MTRFAKRFYACIQPLDFKNVLLRPTALKFGSQTFLCKTKTCTDSLYTNEAMSL